MFVALFASETKQELVALYELELGGHPASQLWLELLLDFDKAVSMVDFGCMLRKFEVAYLARVAALMVELLKVFAYGYIVPVVEANHLFLRTAANLVDFRMHKFLIYLLLLGTLRFKRNFKLVIHKDCPVLNSTGYQEGTHLVCLLECLQVLRALESR